jgi:hypothetical protein
MDNNSLAVNVNGAAIGPPTFSTKERTWFVTAIPYFLCVS